MSHRFTVVPLLLGACSGVEEAPPDVPDAVYEAVLRQDDQAEVGEARLHAYRSEASGCDAADWVELTGPCRFVGSPDPAGFVEIDEDVEGEVICRFRGADWLLTGGNVLVEIEPTAALFQFAPDEACALLEEPLASLLGPLCLTEPFYRLELTLRGGSVSGLAESPVPAASTWGDGRCGPL